MQIIPSFRDNELIKEIRLSKADGQLTSKLHRLFGEMIDAVGNKPNWKKRPELAVMKVLAMDYLTTDRCWQSFKPEISMYAYSFFHTVIMSVFIRHISSLRPSRVSSRQQIHKTFIERP